MATVFRPFRRLGLLLHLGMLLLNGALVAWIVVLALAQTVSGFFILLIILAVVLFLPIPVIIYRFMSLMRAKYTIDRDGLHIEWGLRTEDIPMHEIEWIRSPQDVALGYTLPRFSIPGAVLGVHRHRDLGEIEFIASDSSKLLLIATPQRIFAISPDGEAEFMTALQRTAELGTITPIQGKSTGADFLVNSLLADKPARVLILTGAVLSAVLLVLSAFIIPTRETIALGFDPLRQVPEIAPANRLLLLSILSILIFFTDLGMGAYLFRKEGYKNAAYMIFAAAIISPLSFIALIVVFILL